MATVVTTGGDYIATGGGSVHRWEPANYVLQAGETGFLGYPTLADLQALDLQGSVPRTLIAIYTDIAALTSTQKLNIQNDLKSGSPIKILLDTGPMSSVIWTLHWAVTNASLPAAAINDAWLHAAAAYVQDNPTYLVHPAFDATINVSGTRLQ